MKEKFAAAVGKIICLSVEGIKEIMLLLSVFSASPGVVGNEQKKFLRYAEKADPENMSDEEGEPVVLRDGWRKWLTVFAGPFAIFHRKPFAASPP